MVSLVGFVDDNPENFEHHFFVCPCGEAVLGPLVLQSSVNITSPVFTSYVIRL